MEYQVTCVTKPNRFSPHDHITEIGGGPANGRWRISREEAIHQIDQGLNSFYVKDSLTGRTAYVGVVRAQGKVPYLRTHADGYWNDNLLSLNECSLAA